MTLIPFAERRLKRTALLLATAALSVGSLPQTAAAQSPDAINAQSSWPGDYVTNKGSRIAIKATGHGLLKGEGFDKDNVPETFYLKPEETATGPWVRRSAKGQLDGSWLQGPVRFDLTLKTDDQAEIYRLCRVDAEDANLVSVSRGVWAELASKNLSQQADGSTTLYVQLFVLNAGESTRFVPANLSIELADTPTSRPAQAYFDASALEDNTRPVEIDACGQAIIVFRLKNVTRAHKTLAIHVAGTRSHDWDISALTANIVEPTPQQPVPQQPQPPVPQQPQQPLPQPQPPQDDFQPLGIWDVRIDKVENPREDRLTHVYVTLRNASTQTQVQTGDVWVYLEDTSGVTQRTGQGVRAIPGPPQLFGSPPPVTLPGKTIKAKYVLDRVRGASIAKITIVEGDHQAEFAF